MSSLQSFQLVFLCFMVVFITCGSLGLLWGSLRFLGISEMTVIHKRLPSITAMTVFLSLIVMAVILCYLMLLTFGDGLSSSAVHIVYVMATVMDVVCIEGILYLLFLRFWLSNFQTNHAIAILENEWTVHLDPYHIQNTNFYFAKLGQFGSIWWVGIRLFVIYAVSVSISIAISVLILQSMASVYCLCIVIMLECVPICGNICILKSASSFYDHLYLREEMRKINGFCILYICNELWFLFVRCLSSWESTAITVHSDSAAMAAVYSLFLFVRSCLIGALCFISTEWIVGLVAKEYGSYSDAKNASSHCTSDLKRTTFRFIHSKDHSAGNAQWENQEEDDIRLPIFYRHKKPLEDIEISKMLKLPQILSRNESFTLFMQHLSRESASMMAALLSFVEVVQFKAALVQRLDGIEEGTFDGGSLAPSIPQSVIVHGGVYPLGNDISAESATESMDPLQQKRHEQKRVMKEMKCKAYMLWNKYIKHDAELELRLDNEFRVKLSKEMDQLDQFVNNASITANDLFHLFDDVIWQSYRRMWQSYQRFTNTGDYEMVYELFQKKKSAK